MGKVGNFGHDKLAGNVPADLANHAEFIAAAAFAKMLQR
jgi:hypothetical protein